MAVAERNVVKVVALLNVKDAAKEARDLAQRRRFQLIETMAEESAALLLSRFPQVSRVKIEIRKPAAVPAAECSFVRVERMRS